MGDPNGAGYISLSCFPTRSGHHTRAAPGLRLAALHAVDRAVHGDQAPARRGLVSGASRASLPRAAGRRQRCSDDDASADPLHDLRHGAASMLIATGVPMKLVSYILGHASIAAFVPRRGRPAAVGAVKCAISGE